MPNKKKHLSIKLKAIYSILTYFSTNIFFIISEKHSKFNNKKNYLPHFIF